MFNILKKKNKKEKLGSDVDIIKDKERDYEKEIENNINVYVMPERFRVVHKQKSRAKTMGIFIMAAGAVFLVAVSVLSYFYLTKEKPAVTEPAPPAIDVKNAEDKTQIKKIKKEDTQKPAVAPATIETPKESYMKAKAKLDKAATFNDFERLILKYGSKNRIKEFEKEKKQVEGAPDSFKNNIVSLVIRQTMPKLDEIGDIKEEIKGNTAILSAVTKDLSRKGNITMKREDGVWKLNSEGWEDAKEEAEGTDVAPTEQAGFNSGADGDADGLTDKEEVALGSDIDGPDSDGDGYSDLSEVLNLYNPVGEGKLEASPAIKKYKNNTYGYSLFYPSDWLINKIEGDDSVIFKSADNHFVQVITQKNADKQSMDEWYERQFNVSNIDNSRRISGEKWKGIKNEDDLTVYLTDDNRDYIYTITYNFGDGNVLEYKNIFDMMVKSFSVGQ